MNMTSLMINDHNDKELKSSQTVLFPSLTCNLSLVSDRWKTWVVPQSSSTSTLMWLVTWHWIPQTKWGSPNRKWCVCRGRRLYLEGPRERQRNWSESRTSVSPRNLTCYLWHNKQNWYSIRCEGTQVRGSCPATSPIDDARVGGSSRDEGKKKWQEL